MMALNRKRVDYAQQAGIHCNDDDFLVYVAARLRWRSGKVVEIASVDPDFAAEWIRRNCSIRSRSELNGNNQARQMWVRIVQDFRHWKKKTGRFEEVPA